ncbi:RNA exonuclease 4 isoform X2 [Toxorhynchites rutilus septentrionalis]|uniref:RNA exonuclease 4 isoform X2 n=1 Tax=Toxorhynchites rutilus septentrionalis TaxID=329112 RepID=UPI00247AE382|nr:RNA exonuclease 4 isoform X2 [Toxorhynchites rutilus septentrionalis]
MLHFFKRIAFVSFVLFLNLLYTIVIDVFVLLLKMVNETESGKTDADIENILNFGNLSLKSAESLLCKNVIGRGHTRLTVCSTDLTDCLAVDCEFVGVGPHGKEHMIARVSIVNMGGDVILDTYVKPQKTVIDYRTNISGIRPELIESGESYSTVRETVRLMLRGRILVGHGLKNDLLVLNLRHPRHLIRDTSRYHPIARKIRALGTPSLKNLSKLILGEEIQNGIHDSVQDARAAMKIYLIFKEEWEKSMRKSGYRKR